MLKPKKHGVVQSKANIYARTDSVVKISQKDAFNKLIKARDKARYDPSFRIKQEEADILFEEMKKLSHEVFIYLVRYGEIKTNKK